MVNVSVLVYIICTTFDTQTQRWWKDDIIQFVAVALVQCDAYFTYYHYLIYDRTVKNAEGIEVRLYAHSCMVCDNPPHMISIMKSQEGRNLRRHGDQVQFPSYLTTAMCSR